VTFIIFFIYFSIQSYPLCAIIFLEVGTLDRKINKNMGSQIKTIRQKQGISRDDFSKQLEISIHTLSKYEQGQREPNFDILKRIAKALNVPISRLTAIRIEKKTKELMLEKNISIEEMLERTGLTLNQLPITEMDIETIYEKNILEKVAYGLEITFNELIRDTTIENYYIFTEEDQKTIDPLKTAFVKGNELNKMKLSERRDLSHISVSTMAFLLDKTKDEIEEFEKEPGKHPTLDLKYREILSKIEYLEKDILDLFFYPGNIDLKSFVNLKDSQMVDLLIEVRNTVKYELYKLINNTISPTVSKDDKK
jgi:transcriptional regulator with XRE-family HTH domain